jgi:hypothetical protein
MVIISTIAVATTIQAVSASSILSAILSTILSTWANAGAAVTVASVIANARAATRHDVAVMEFPRCG